ncbi:MAG: CoA-transferase [Deltaproteobacteria bacterium RIFOXYA12_FULL_61_11]|nr:MAG: CoA-transferase [Deltaproteobacteria bacterium RIFOXYA12_FULL_61_11]
MTRLLEGVRVLDLTNVLSGPFATLHLALLGAEVLKVENPREGDLGRILGNVPELNKRRMGTSFLAQNANKLSMTLDLKHEEGKAIFRRLVGESDVLVENYRPGVMQRLGLGYEQLFVLNPRLVYCAISGFGQTGPDAGKPAYDQIIQGLSGVMAVNGTPELNPLRCGFPVCDTVGGLNAAFAIMAALFHRERSGEGQFVDVAMLDSILPLMGWVAANLLIGGQPPQLLGNDNFTAAPSGAFRTADGFVNIAANKQEQWEAVAELVGLSALKEDPRFRERDARKRNRKELNVLFEEQLLREPTAHWVQACNARGVPAGAILGLEEALLQPQLEHRETLATVEVEGHGPVRLFNLSAKFGKTPASLDTPPPELSADTDRILARLGYDEAAIAAFHEQGVV